MPCRRKYEATLYKYKNYQKQATMHNMNKIIWFSPKYIINIVENVPQTQQHEVIHSFRFIITIL